MRLTERNVCPICKKPATSWVVVDGIEICSECDTAQEEAKIIERGKSVTHPRDLKEWTGSDMSDLFWLTFIEYRKNPTQQGIELIIRIFLWACHANHTLSSTIYHALKWCGMDMYDERRKMKERDSND